MLFPFCSKKHVKKKWPYFSELIVKIKEIYKNKYSILVAPGPNEIDEAKTFIYVKSEYLKSKSLLIPAHSIARDFDQDKFWKESVNLLREYKFEKDELFKMISIQHKQNLSYTVNNNKFKIIGKLYNA